jgi:hypothetical protein
MGSRNGHSPSRSATVGGGPVGGVVVGCASGGRAQAAHSSKPGVMAGAISRGTSSRRRCSTWVAPLASVTVHVPSPWRWLSYLTRAWGRGSGRTEHRPSPHARPAASRNGTGRRHPRDLRGQPQRERADGEPAVRGRCVQPQRDHLPGGPPQLVGRGVQRGHRPDRHGDDVAADGARRLLGEVLRVVVGPVRQLEVHAAALEGAGGDEPPVVHGAAGGPAAREVVAQEVVVDLGLGAPPRTARAPREWAARAPT